MCYLEQKPCTKMLRKAHFQVNLSESLGEAASRQMPSPPDQTGPPGPKGSGNLIIPPDNFLVLCHGISVIWRWQLFFPEWNMWAEGRLKLLEARNRNFRRPLEKRRNRWVSWQRMGTPRGRHGHVKDNVNNFPRYSLGIKPLSCFTCFSLDRCRAGSVSGVYQRIQHSLREEGWNLGPCTGSVWHSGDRFFLPALRS